MLRYLLRRCEAEGNFRQASVSSGYLLNNLRITGRFDEALDLIEDKKHYTLRAATGPWIQI